MDKTEVQNIVMMTISELKRQGFIRDFYGVALKTTEPILRGYFKGKKNKVLDDFFTTHSDDQYIEVMYLLYRDNVAIGCAADILRKDISTIKLFIHYYFTVTVTSISYT